MDSVSIAVLGRMLPRLPGYLETLLFFYAVTSVPLTRNRIIKTSAATTKLGPFLLALRAASLFNLAIIFVKLCARILFVILTGNASVLHDPWSPYSTGPACRVFRRRP